MVSFASSSSSVRGRNADEIPVFTATIGDPPEVEVTSPAVLDTLLLDIIVLFEQALAWSVKLA